MNPALIPVFMILIFAVVLILIGQAERNSKKTNVNKPSGFDDWQAQEWWEDYPTVKYDKVHTYCSVTFEDNGKTFYYRTRNPELKVGDLVYVPVGYKYEKKDRKDHKDEGLPRLPGTVSFGEDKAHHQQGEVRAVWRLKCFRKSFLAHTDIKPFIFAFVQICVSEFIWLSTSSAV